MAKQPKKADEKPEAIEAEQPADEGQAAPEAEVAGDEPLAEESSEIDPELLKINATLRPMVQADGSDGSCDLYESNKAGHIMVPASDVPAMLEHGFVLVDEA